MMYVRHIIMLYTFNLYSDMCQLYLNKTTKKQWKTNNHKIKDTFITCDDDYKGSYGKAVQENLM